MKSLAALVIGVSLLAVNVILSGAFLGAVAYVGYVVFQWFAN